MFHDVTEISWHARVCTHMYTHTNAPVSSVSEERSQLSDRSLLAGVSLPLIQPSSRNTEASMPGRRHQVFNSESNTAPRRVALAVSCSLLGTCIFVCMCVCERVCGCVRECVSVRLTEREGESVFVVEDRVTVLCVFMLDKVGVCMHVYTYAFVYVHAYMRMCVCLVSVLLFSGQQHVLVCVLVLIFSVNMCLRSFNHLAYKSLPHNITADVSAGSSCHT